MRKIIVYLFIIVNQCVVAQTDFSDRWEDFFSYYNVKDFIKIDPIIYAITDNAIFTYNIENQEINKLSSVQGLSGETTTAIHYNSTFNRLVVGYQNGLIEVIDEDGSITVSPDIVNFNQSGEKEIQHIYEHNNKLYLATSFAIVIYDIERLEFGETYFIGMGSSDENINEITFLDNTIYAATNNGVYTANITNPNLIDANNWTLRFVGNYQNICTFNNAVYAANQQNLVKIMGNNSIQIFSFSEDIVSVKSTTDYLSIALKNRAIFYNTNLVQIAESVPTTDFDFNLNTALAENNTIFLGTTEFGILSTPLNSPMSFQEIHPDGPLNNSPFSIAVANDNLWVVYGGYDATFTPRSIRQGYSHFNNNTWINKRFDPNFPVTDLNHISIDPSNNQHVFLSSMGSTSNVNSVATGGLLEINNDEIVNFYNHINSPLEDILINDPNNVTIRITGTTFDNQGDLWINNIGVDKRLKKRSATGQWSSFDLSSLFVNFAYGMNEITMDQTRNFWIGTRRNGAYIFNENGEKKRALTTEPTKGSLPNLNVRTIAVDRNNSIWLGTLSGLVVFNNASTVFEDAIYDAAPIIILDDGIAKKLLGEQTINTIVVDGGDNKWFGTENAGVLYTNPNGQNTLANFNTSNSPLPSNKILKISVDNSTGKVYFATDKGIVVYNSNVSPFGDVLCEVYAFPNPALSAHNTVTIDGRNGTHLPKGTNVKILDVAGNLVYETNVVEGQELQGGKVVWDKKNLAGKKVASGVYIVLLSNEDGSENASTKIAIVN